MELRQLRYFVRIADLGSFSKASKALHIVQPALSQQIASLEGEVGHELLARTPAGVCLTEQGEVFYAHAQRVLQQLDDMKGALQQSAKGVSGTVRIGLPQSTALRFAMPLVRTLGETHPGIQLEFFDEISGRLIHALRRGQIDVAVIVNDDAAALLDSVPLMDEALVLVSRPGAEPKLAQLPVAQLATLPLALPGQGQGVRDLVEEVLKTHGLILPRPKLVANSMAIMLRAVREGIAHGVMPWGAVGELIESGAMVQTPISSLARRVHVSTCKDFPLSAAARVVFDQIVAQTRAQVTRGEWQAVTLVG